MVNSHIQVPKSLLKKFSSRKVEIENNKPVKRRYVYYLNLKTKTIDCADIKELNAEFGYYSEKAEKQLSKIESDFGECVAQVISFLGKNFNKTDKTFNISQYEQTVKKFIFYSLARTKKILSKIQEKSDLYENFPEYYTPSNIAEKTESAYNKLDILDDYGMTVLYAEDYRFVLPKYCWYSGFIDKETIVLPFSPNYAFVLFPNKNISNYLLEEGQLGIVTIEKREILIANRCALITEQDSDNEFVVAEKEQELIDLIPYIK